MKKTAGIMLAFICFAASGTGISSYAQTSGEFSIRAVIPENQIDKKQTYFDLRMKPGDEQTLEVIITNSRSEDMVADLSLNAASTGRNGLIVYTEPDVRDDIMKVAITDVAALRAQKITVPANSSKTAYINIKMPDEPVDGIILGGIAVTGNKVGDSDIAAQGVSLNNTITYVTALKITENDNEVEPDFSLTAVTPKLINYRTAVVVSLQNKAARIVKSMGLKARVFRKDSDSMLHELTLDNAEMAPLSKGDFVIDWENQPLGQGTYRLKMTADYNGRTWEWDEDFSIGAEAGDLNNGAMGLNRDYTWLYGLAGAAALTLVWFVAYSMGKRRREAGADGSRP